MNLYSQDFLKDCTSVPIKKNLYVYIWRGNRIAEYLAEFRLYDVNLINMDNYKSKLFSNTVQVIKELNPETKLRNNGKLAKTFTISLESGKVNNGKLWLPDSDIVLARDLFILDKEKRMEECLQKIDLLRKEIEVLKKL